MTRWKPSGRGSVLASILLGLACSAPMRAQDSAPTWLTRFEVQTVIHVLADALRTAPGAESKPATPDLAALAEHLRRTGGTAALRAIAHDWLVPPVDASLAAILLARIESPDIFAAVAPYYQPGAESPSLELMPQPRVPRVLFGPMKPIALELLHPDTRAAVAAHREAHAQLVAAMQRLDEDTRSQKGEGIRAWEDIQRVQAQRLAAIRAKYQVPEQEFELLAQASGAQSGLPRLDPRYRPAWEEGLLRLDVTWAMKRQLLYVVTSFQAAGSGPIIGLATQQALVQKPSTSLEDQLYEYFASDALAGLLDRPSRESLCALADVIIHARGDKRVKWARMIGRRVSESESWTKLLDSFQGDDRLDGSVRELREAVAKWKEFEPTYYGRRDSTPLSRAEVRTLIDTAVDALRAPPGAETKPAAADLAALAERLKVGGALPALRTVAADGQSTPLESAMARILLARIESPELFAAVAPYYVCDAENSLRGLSPAPRQGWPPDGHRLKPIALELLHPDTRLAVAAHADAYTQLQAAVRSFMESARTDRVVNTNSLPRLLDELRAAEETIRVKYGVSRDDMDRLSEASGPAFERVPNLDQRYLPAWEEGLLRPDITWPMKATLVHVVASFKDASTPIVALCAEQARIQKITKQGEGVDGECFELLAIRTIADHPGPDALWALADLILRAEGDERPRIQRAVGKRLSEEGRWTKLLDSLQDDAQLGESVRELRDAVAKWKEFEPTYHRRKP
jgi:hypothetical protein